jgi:hypothetical protein
MKQSETERESKRNKQKEELKKTYIKADKGRRSKRMKTEGDRN